VTPPNSMLDVCSFEVPGRGLEPLRISPPDPKSGASANFATLASLIYSDLRINRRNDFLRVLEVVLESRHETR
jgi:hypothetical protein